MSTDWFHERAVVLVISVASVIRSQGTSLELEQILFDSLRIYSRTFQGAPTMNLVAGLMNIDRPLRDEDLDKVKMARALILARPEDAVSVLEKFASL